MVLLLVALVGLHVVTIFAAGVDDAGIWGANGAVFLLEQGRMPYGSLGEGGTYGPLAYLLFVPFVSLWPPGAMVGGYEVWIESFTAARVVALLADLVLIGGMLVLGRKLRDWHLGLLLAFGIACIPYAVTSLGWVSQLVPAALLIWALVMAVDRADRGWKAAVSGALLAAGAVTYFYPAFAFPLWAGWFRGRRRWAFIVTFALVGLLCLGTVLMGRWGEAGAAVQDFWYNTVVHQEGGTGTYGASEFGFWGVWPALRFLKRPLLLGYLLFCAGLCWWCWRVEKVHVDDRGFTLLLGLTGAVVVGTQLWKTHGGGTYHLWWIPFVAIWVGFSRLPSVHQGRSVLGHR
jgi:hypothetical protein